MTAASGAGGAVAAKVEGLLAPALEALGYGIVRVQFNNARRTTLQIMAERHDGAAMSVDDCAQISRTASALLDVEDPIPGAYDLEVSSPGIDRPLTRRHDFERFAGFEAKLETDRLLDGRRRFRGRLIGVAADGVIRIRDAGAEYAVPFDAVTKAKLVLTEELIAHSPAKPRH
ncbi:MAG: ribosome maturation factor RimP [Proteobacteria bacterium]|nr:ribosome maturation factor RimP [Pseudomonadota bacterium]